MTCGRRDLRPGYESTDRRVSIEVDPRLATDTHRTVAEARLWCLADRPNLLIKIPATVEGLPAITQDLSEGITVNITLICSLDRYDAVIDAFTTGAKTTKPPPTWSQRERKNDRFAQRCSRSAGGDEGTRTPNPRLAKAVLCQLSYAPEMGQTVVPALGLGVAGSSVASCHRSASARSALMRLAATAKPTAATAMAKSFFGTDVTSISEVGLSGLEPLTSALSGQRSNRLSYRPQCAWLRYPSRTRRPKPAYVSAQIP